MIGAVMVLAAVGLADSLYLVWVHATASKIICPVGGCDIVNASPYAQMGPIPVAAIGAAGYLGLLAMAAMAWRAAAAEGHRRWLRLLFMASALGVLYSAYLTYLELFVIGAICFWCVISALTITLICLASGLALRRSHAVP